MGGLKLLGAMAAAAALVLSCGALAPAGADEGGHDNGNDKGELTWRVEPVATQTVIFSSMTDCSGNTEVTPGKVSVTDPGSVSPEPATVTYEWVANGVVIGTGTDLIVNDPNPGSPLVLRATATAEGQSPAVTVSKPIRLMAVAGSGVCVAPRGVAAIKGRAKVGATLQARYSGVGKVAKYRWFRDGARIKGASAAKYRVTTKDARHRLSVKVMVRRERGVTIVRSAPTSRVRL